MSIRNDVWRRRAALVAGGVGLALAVAAAGCGSGGGSSQTTQTSTPASTPTQASTPASTPASSPPPASSSSSDSALSGKWKGTYGGAYTGTFTLNWTEASSKLNGTIDLSQGGRTSVQGTVDGSSIKFGTVGGAQVITYTGTVNGSSMSGSYSTPGGNGTWSAHKA